AVRQREGPTRENLPDDAVGEANLHRRGVLALDVLHEAAHRAVDVNRGSAGEMKQAIGRVVAGVDQLSAALRLHVRPPRVFERIAPLPAGAETILAAKPENL